MLRRLVLLRHARAVDLWTGPETPARGADHARPLTPDGQEDAVEIGAELATRGWFPERVLCSDSARTRQTWVSLAAALGSPSVSYEPSLYHADADTLLEELGLVEASVGTVLVLGHNPGLQELAWELTGEDVGLATANALLMCGEGETWSGALRPGRWRLDGVLRPRFRG